MTRLYLIRHGESMGNASKVFTGQIDMPLTDLGREQARRTAVFLSDVKFDAAYGSDLVRAYETGEIVCGGKLHVTADKNLREINAGLWEGVRYEDVAQRYPQEYSVWRTDIGRARPVDGESVAELFDRVNAELDRIAAKEAGKTVLIATHATPIRCIVCRITGFGAENLQNIAWVANSSVTVIDYENGKYTPVTIGYADHLKDMETVLPAVFPVNK